MVPRTGLRGAENYDGTTLMAKSMVNANAMNMPNMTMMTRVKACSSSFTVRSFGLGRWFDSSHRGRAARGARDSAGRAAVDQSKVPEPLLSGLAGSLSDHQVVPASQDQRHAVVAVNEDVVVHGDWTGQVRLSESGQAAR